MSDKTESELLELERQYCSWGDTVHYLDPPKSFERAISSPLRPFFRSGALRAVPVLFPLPVRQEGRGLRAVLPETVRAEFRHRVQLLLGCEGRRIRVLGVLRRTDSGDGRLRDSAA